MANSTKINRKKYYAVYSVVFFALFFFCFEIYMLMYHKSPMRHDDTYDMHYMQFLYLGRWIRAAIHGFQFPVWDSSIGYGADFFLTMSGFVCDPINWIAAVTPSRFAEIGVLLTLIARFYLAGAAFSEYAFHKGGKAYAVLCGTIVYIFTACAYTGMYQPKFMIPLYTFPLILYGIDILFERNDSRLYVSALTYSAVTSFYLTYMIAILLILYALLKWFFDKKESASVKTFAVIFARIFTYSLLSAGMAAVVLLPVANLMLGMGRLDLQRFVPALYDFNFYADMFKGFISNYDMQGRDCKIGFSVIALICVSVFFSTRTGKYKQQKIEFLLISLGLCLPLVGHIMNGFGYVANRWIWAYSLLVSYIVVIIIPELKELSCIRWFSLLLFVGAYVFISYQVFNASGREFLVLSIVLVIVSLVIVEFRNLAIKEFERLVVILSCICVMIPAYFQYDRRYRNSFTNNVAAGEALSIARESGGLPLLDKCDTTDGSRFNRYGLTTIRNASWIYHVGGMDFYMNMYNDAIDRFHNSVALNTSAWPFGYDGLDRRSELLALLSVNHFFTKANNTYKPVNFTEPEAVALGKEGVIESWKPLQNYNLFIAFQETVPEKTYYTLNPFERQELLMHALVIDDDTVGMPAVLPEFSGDVEYEMILRDGISLNETGVSVSAQNAVMELVFPAQKESEVYVYFDNLQYENGLASIYMISEEGLYEGKSVRNTYNGFMGLNNISHMYGGKNNWLLNLGVIHEGIDQINVCFGSTGQYTFDGIYVFSKPIECIKENILNLNFSPAQAEFGPDTVTLDYQNDQDEYLLFTYPYSDGWSASDNGREIDIFKADIGFMGVKLSAGTHQLVFRYRTPGIISGSIISAVSIVGYFALLRSLKKKAGRKL